MYLVIVLLLIPQARALVSNEYNGFDSCGENGWVCESIFPGSEITFNCSLSRSRNGRLWIWTARLPNRIKKVTAANCDHLELHVDCTRSYRDTQIEQFRVINVRELTILKPTNTYEFLHDNYPHPHLPPYFHLENIGRVSFYKGLFGSKNESSCNYNTGTIKKMVMKNVHVANVDNEAFHIQLEQISWTNVTFHNIEIGGVTINGTEINIDESHIGEIQNKAFTLNGRNVNLRWNTFKTIGPGSINAYTFAFVFSHNKVHDINSRGLVVQSSHVIIENNTIGDLAKEALGAVSPAYYIGDSVPMVYTISYTFTGNEILFMNRFSLHPDWKGYGNHGCSQITLDSNKFNCDCENLFWLRQYAQAEYSGFYQLMLNTTHHCGTNTNCSLSNIIPYVCKNETKLVLQCTGFTDKETFHDVNFNDTEVSNMTARLKGDTESEDGDNLNWKSAYSNDKDNDSGSILGKVYYEDKYNSISNKPSSSGLSANLWVVIVVAVIIKSACLVSVVAWYIKRRKRYNSAEIYKYDKTNDSDNLITHIRSDAANECENPSFN